MFALGAYGPTPGSRRYPRARPGALRAGALRHLRLLPRAGRGLGPTPGLRLGAGFALATLKINNTMVASSFPGIFGGRGDRDPGRAGAVRRGGRLGADRGGGGVAGAGRLGGRAGRGRARAVLHAADALRGRGQAALAAAGPLLLRRGHPRPGRAAGEDLLRLPLGGAGGRCAYNHEIAAEAAEPEGGAPRPPGLGPGARCSTWSSTSCGRAGRCSTPWWWRPSGRPTRDVPTVGDYLVLPLVLERKWRDTWSSRLGGQYNPLEWLTIRLGGYYETGAAPDAYYSVASPDADKIGVALGVGFRIVGLGAGRGLHARVPAAGGRVGGGGAADPGQPPPTPRPRPTSTPAPTSPPTTCSA
ncbi:MAG: outer membrane protein transport protein [Candidatus Moduliflexus flocculans]|nr:outer membrane protein transport protein [Candidatus Moduliflexus flocculans]